MRWSLRFVNATVEGMVFNLFKDWKCVVCKKKFMHQDLVNYKKTGKLGNPCGHDAGEGKIKREPLSDLARGLCYGK